MRGFIWILVCAQAWLQFGLGLFLGPTLGYFGQATALFIGAVLGLVVLVYLTVEEKF